MGVKPVDKAVFTAETMSSQERIALKNCIAFSFEKERYTPYSQLNAVFALTQEVGEIKDIELTVNDVPVHKGLMDTQTYTERFKNRLMSITSRGYTSALGYNILPGGILYNVTSQSLLGNYYTMPFVTAQEDYQEQAGFIYVKEHSTVWDAAVNLCLKLEGNYPYIKYPDKILFNKHTPLIKAFADSEILTLSHSYDHKRIMSHFHMADTSGEAQSYNYTNDFATARNIIRHRHIPFDRQWLSTETLGLSYKCNYTMRGKESISLLYKGFGGEDINDIFSYGDSAQLYISKVKISGNNKGIFTTLTAYNDSYCNIGN